MPGCCAIARDRHSFHGSKRCSREGVVEAGGKFYCRQHDPERIAARKVERSALHDAKWQERRKEIHGPAMFSILTKIAEGHNDPRSLAAEFLEKFHGA